MTEKIINLEARREGIPTLEELKKELERIIGDEDFKYQKILRKGSLVYYIEIRLTNPDDDGYFAEYNYMAKGRYDDARGAGESRIHVYYHDADGDFFGGGTVVSVYGKNGWVRS